MYYYIEYLISQTLLSSKALAWHMRVQPGSQISCQAPYIGRFAHAVCDVIPKKEKVTNQLRSFLEFTV